MPTKRVTVHYRRIVDGALQDVDFRRCFDDGLNGQIDGVQLRNSDQRRIRTGSDGRRMCLLSPYSEAAFCFGEVAVFRDGDVPIAETDAAGQVHLRTIVLEGNEEAVRGTSYFMARGPHVALLHHESSTRFVEDYLRWLFLAPIGNLPVETMLSLQPLINMEGRLVQLREVKALTLRAEVETGPPARDGEVERVDPRPQTFRRMIDRRPLDGGHARAVLRAMGMSDGSLARFNEGDFEDLEFELLVRRREDNRISPLPDHLIQGVLDDGFDRAAEFQTDGTRRRGDAIVASYPADVDVDGAYYNIASARQALWAALGEWANQGLI